VTFYAFCFHSVDYLFLSVSDIVMICWCSTWN